MSETFVKPNLLTVYGVVLGNDVEIVTIDIVPRFVYTG